MTVHEFFMQEYVQLTLFGIEIVSRKRKSIVKVAVMITIIDSTQWEKEKLVGVIKGGGYAHK